MSRLHPVTKGLESMETSGQYPHCASSFLAAAKALSNRFCKAGTRAGKQDDHSSNRVCPMTSDVHSPILDFKWLVGRTEMGIIKAETCWSFGGCICNTYLLAALWQVYWQMEQHPQTSHWTWHGLHFMCFWPDPRVLCKLPQDRTIVQYDTFSLIWSYLSMTLWREFHGLEGQKKSIEILAISSDIIVIIPSWKWGDWAGGHVCCTFRGSSCRIKSEASFLFLFGPVFIDSFAQQIVTSVNLGHHETAVHKAKEGLYCGTVASISECALYFACASVVVAFPQFGWSAAQSPESDSQIAN